MSLTRVRSPWVRDLKILPSQYYAKSPYRPYVGIFKDDSNVHTEVSNFQLIQALSPFSVNDRNVINKIRESYDIIDTGRYQTASNIGAVAGVGAGIALSGALYGKAIYGGLTKLTLAKLGLGAATLNPIGLAIGATATALAVAGTIKTSKELGKAIGASIGSKEGSIAMGRYLSNLGSSLVKRPTTTVLTAGTIYATNFALRSFGINQPYIRQGATMVSLRLARPLFDGIDRSLFGELSDIEQMSYTDLIALQGDLADDFSGTTYIKAGLAGLVKDYDYAKDLIAKAYGTHEEGFDPLDFMDVREAYGIDIGSFGNGVIDILGEIVFDVDNAGVSVRNKTNTTLSSFGKNSIIKKILSDENSALFQRYFEKVDGKIEAKDTFKNEFGNKKIERIIESYLMEYKDPNLAKTEKQKQKIKKSNEAALEKNLLPYYTYLVKNGLPNIEQGQKGLTASSLKEALKKEIKDALDSLGDEIKTKEQNKAKYLKSFEKIVEAQKEAEKKYNEGMAKHRYNFDAALLKEMDTHNFILGRERMRALLRTQPILRAYAMGNDTLMTVLGYFTRPTQSIFSNKTVHRVLKSGFGRALRVFDPSQKTIDLEEDIFSGNVTPLTREQYEKNEKDIKELRKLLNKEINEVEESYIKEYLGGDSELEKFLDELNEIKNKYDFESTKKEVSETEEVQRARERMEFLIKEIKRAKTEATQKMIENNPEFKKYKEALEELDKKTEELRASDDLLKKYEDTMVYAFIRNGKKETEKITEENVKDVEKQIEELEKNKMKTAEEYEKLSQMQMAYVRFMNFNKYKKEYMKAINSQNNIVNMISALEQKFLHRYYVIQTTVLRSTLFSSEGKKEIEVFKELKKDIKELEKNRFKTQDEKMEEITKGIQLRYDKKIEEIYLTLKNSQIFDEATINKISNILRTNGEVELDINYATNFFSMLKLAKDKEDKDLSFMNNNETLFKRINEILEDDKIQESLNIFRNFLKRRHGKPYIDEREIKPIINRFYDQMKSILATLHQEGLLSEVDYEILKEKYIEISQNIIYTHSKMTIEDGRRKNSYKKKFLDMDQYEMQKYVYKLSKEENSFNNIAFMISTELQRLDMLLKALEKRFANSPVEQIVHQIIKKEMNHISYSKLVNAINSKFLNVGMTRHFFEMEKESKEKPKILTEQEVKDIDKKVEEILSGKSYIKDKENIRQVLGTEVRRILESTPFKDIIKTTNKDKFLNELIEDVLKEVVADDFDLNQRVSKYEKISENIIKVIKDKDIQLGKEEETKIRIKVLEFFKNQRDYVENKIKTLSKDSIVEEKELSSFLLRKLKESFGGEINVNQIKNIIRGNVRYPDTKISLERSEGEGIIDFMKNNDPTLENILKLKLQDFGTYANRKGLPVRLEKFSQFRIEELPEKWKSESFRAFTSEDDPKVVEFFSGVKMSDSESYNRFFETTFNLPAFLREHFEINKLDKKDFDEIKDSDNLKEEELKNDILKALLKLKKRKTIKKISVLKKTVNVVKDYETINGEKITIENDIEVIRIHTSKNKFYDLYIPKRSNEKYNIYKINGNEYIRMKVYGEEDKLQYLKNFSNAIKLDFEKSLLYSDKKNSFSPYFTQREIFRTFFRQRDLKDEKNRITDFQYLDPTKTDYEKFLLKHSYRIDKKTQSLILDFSEEFVKELKDNGFSLDGTQGDPNSVLKKIKIGDEEVSLTQIVNPLYNFTTVGNRSARATFSIRNAIRLLNPSKSLLRSEYSTSDEVDDQALDVGFNAKVLLKDVVFDLGELEGAATYNEAVIMKRSFAETLKTTDRKGNVVSMADVKKGFKIMDRHSSKYQVIVIDDSKYEEQLKKLNIETDADVIISKQTVRKRGLSNVEAELSINQNTNEKIMPNFSKDEAYLSLESKEEKSRYLYERLQEFAKTNGGNKELNSDSGFLYMYLVDDLKETFKASGDSGKDGAAFSMEELQLFEALNEITDEKGNILDPENILLDFIMKKSRDNKKEIQQEIYDNEVSIGGKKGIFRQSVIKREIKNSADSKVITNHKLPGKTVKIPKEMAKKVNIFDFDKNQYKDKGSQKAYFHRFPSVGRRSFGYVNVIINDDPSIKVVETSSDFDKALNLDFDGDRIQLYFLKGASKEVLDLSEKIFSHDKKEKEFSDYPSEQINKLFNDEELKKDLDEYREFDFETKDFSENYNPYSDDFKIKDINKNFLEEDDFDNSLINQKVLKDYAAIYKDLFNSDFQEYISSDSAKEWFNSYIKEEGNELSELGIRSFYGWITFGYQFYSQKSFDFSKHGNEAQKFAFEKIYNLIRRNPNESFEDHFKRMAKIIISDFKITMKYKEKIKSTDEAVKKEAINSYRKELKEKLNQLEKEFEKKEFKDPEETLQLDTHPLRNRHKRKVKQFKTNKEILKKKQDQLIKDILEEYDIDMKDLDIGRISEEQLMAKISKNKKRREFSFQDYSINEEVGKNLFKFIIDEYKINYTESLSDRQKNVHKALRPIYNTFKGFFVSVIEDFYQEKDLIENLKIVFKFKNGKEGRVRFLDLFKVYDQNLGMAFEATYSNIDPTFVSLRRSLMINNMQLEKIPMKGFYFEVPDVYKNALEEKEDNFYNDLDVKIDESLKNLGVGFKLILSPILHDKMLFETDVYNKIYKDLISDENNSGIGQLLKATKDKESMEEIIEILKPFLLKQTILNYLEGNQRTNLMKFIYGIENIFNSSETIRDEFNSEEVSLFLVDQGYIKTVSEFQKFEQDIIEKLKIDDENVMADIYEIAKLLESGLKNGTTYGSDGDLKNMGYLQKIDLITRIYKIRNGMFLDEIDNKLNFTKEDASQKLKDSDFGTFERNRFLSILNKLEKTIMENYSIKNREEAMNILKSERSTLFVVDSLIKRMNRILGRTHISNMYLQNVKEGDAWKYRSLLQNDNSKESNIVIKRDQKNKIITDINRGLNHLEFNPFNKDAKDTEFVKEIQEFSSKYKVGSDLLSLFYFKNKTSEELVDILDKLIQDTHSKGFPVTNNRLKSLMHLNKINKTLGIGRGILSDTIEEFYREINTKPIAYLGEGLTDVVKRTEIYRLLFLDYMVDLQKENKVEYERLTNVISEAAHFFRQTTSLSTQKLDETKFLYTFFGKMIFNERVYKDRFEESSKNILEKSEELQKEYITKILSMKKQFEERKDSTSRSFLDRLKNLKKEDNIEVIIREYTKDEELIEKIKSDFKAFKKVKTIKENDVLDTFIWAKYTKANEYIKTFPLYNIYAQLFGIKHLDEKKLGNKIKRKISREGGDVSNVVGKLHDSAIDTELTFMVLDKISKGEYSEEDFGALKNYFNNLKDFKDKSKRKNFVIFDIENIVSSNADNKIHQISYIIFDEQGNKIHKNFRFPVELDDATIRWYMTDNGYSQKDIDKMINKEKADVSHDFIEKTFNTILEDFDGKVLVGQNISSFGGPGDIQKLNEDMRFLKEMQLLNSIKKANQQEKDFLDSLEKLNFEDLLKSETIEKLDNERKARLYKDFILEKLKDDLKKRIYPDDSNKETDSPEREALIEKNKQILNIFLETTDSEAIHKRMQEVMGTTIPKNVFNEIHELYKMAYKHYVENGSIGVKLPKYYYDEELDKVVIKYEEVYNDSDLSTFEQKLFRIDYDPTNSASIAFFRTQAFYEVVEKIKDLVKINGRTYSSIERMKYNELKYNPEDFNRDIPEVDIRLKKAEEETDPIEKLIQINRAIKAQESKENEKESQEFWDNELKVSDDELNRSLSDEVTTEKLATTSHKDFIRAIEDAYNRLFSDILNNKLGNPEKEENSYGFQRKIINIVDALDKANLNQDSSDVMTKDEFSKITGLFKNDDMTEVLYNELLDTYKEYVNNGITFKLKDDSDSRSKLEYDESIDYTFKKLAFYKILYSSESLEGDVKSLFMSMIKEEDVKPFEIYQEDPRLTEEINERTKDINDRIIHNEKNELNFSNRRIEIKNMILNEKWEELGEYLKKHPNYGTELLKSIDSIKEELNNFLNEKIEEGLNIKEKPEYVLKDGRITIEQKVIRKQKYSREEINSNKFLKQYFIKQIINENLRETINDMLYIDEYITTVSDEAFSGVLTYKYYMSNLENFDAKRIKSNFKEDNNVREEINESYGFLFKNHQKSKDLSKYQSNFYDFIESFRLKNPKSNAIEDQYDIDRLYKEISEGYLGKIYNITLIAESSKREQKFFRKTGQEGNIYYNEESLKDLRSKHDLSKDEDIFGNSLGKVTDIKNTSHPTLKSIDIKNKQQLIELLRYNEVNDLKLGFTIKIDLLKTDKMSYKEYKVPKPLQFIQANILYTQKMLMLMNHGFIVRNFYDGLIRNHRLIVGSDTLINENYRFAKEGIRSWQLVFKYKRYSTIHFNEVADLKSMLMIIKDFENGNDGSFNSIKKLSDDLRLKTGLQIDRIEKYLNNIIYSEKQTSEKRASSNYLEFTKLLKNLQEIKERLDNNEFSNLDDYFKLVRKSYLDYFNVYRVSGFFKQIVMNSHSKKSRLNFDSNDPDNVRSTKDELNLLKFINEIEKSGAISDQYEIAGKQDIRKMYREISNIDNFLDTEFKNHFITSGLDKIINHKNNYMKNLVDLVEQTQRIHGILLDTHHLGKHKDVAMTESLNRFFNYGIRGAFEKSSTLYFPFVSFAIRNFDFYLETLRDPRYMRFMANVSQGMREWYREEDEEDDNYRFSNDFLAFTENQGWIPLTKNFGMKMGNAMFDAIDLIENPFEAVQQKLNPVIQQVNKMSKGQGFDYDKLPLYTAINRTSQSLTNIAKGNVQTPTSVVPSLFYDRSEFVPYKYRRDFAADYRNINRTLFFQDGSRRSQSRNPYTTAKNIRYQHYVNARLSGARR